MNKPINKPIQIVMSNTFLIGKLLDDDAMCNILGNSSSHAYLLYTQIYGPLDNHLHRRLQERLTIQIKHDLIRISIDNE